MQIVLLIPAYKPDQKMIDLLTAVSLQKQYCAILVIDDGSDDSTSDVFSQAAAIDGVVVLRHGVNMGKGRAIKTALNYVCLQHKGACVVTADCDGQHSPKDILGVAKALIEHPDHFIVGGRAFTGNVPAKSRIGNAIMRFLFFLATGVKVHDTQTGLRGIPACDVAREAIVPGERYEYEMNILLGLSSASIPIQEIPIDTIYLNQNAGSHFDPVRDALRVVSRLLSFVSAAIASFVVDYLLYFVFLSVLGLGSSFAFILARIPSSLVNFTLNRSFVFQKKGSLVRHAIGYYALVLAIMAAGTAAVYGLTKLGVNPYLAKILADIVLFMVSFTVQRFHIFA